MNWVGESRIGLLSKPDVTRIVSFLLLIEHT